MEILLDLEGILRLNLNLIDLKNIKLNEEDEDMVYGEDLMWQTQHALLDFLDSVVYRQNHLKPDASGSSETI